MQTKAAPQVCLASVKMGQTLKIAAFAENVALRLENNGKNIQTISKVKIFEKYWFRRNKMKQQTFGFIAAIITSASFANPAFSDDGLLIVNHTSIVFDMDTVEDNSCNSNNLKGGTILAGNHSQAYDVSGHSGESCWNTTTLFFQGGDLAIQFKFAMSDGNPAHLQNFEVLDKDDTISARKLVGTITINDRN